jgi:hypothetical protein
MRLSLGGAAGLSASGWLAALAAQTADAPQRRRACILLWMAGGPTQTDTFDLKPGHANGGPYKPIDTSVSGIQISEHLPKLAQQMEHIALIRSMSTKEGDHTRATYLMRTGYLPQGPISYPALGAALGKELGPDSGELPNYVSIAPFRQLSPGAFGPGFLGAKYAPLVVGANVPRGPRNMTQDDQGLTVQNLKLPEDVTVEQAEARVSLVGDLDAQFHQLHPDAPSASHVAAYQQAVRMMRSESVKAFDLADEPAEVRDAYGRNQFGQGCLLARRLVERGVPFVEISLNNANGQGLGWDTHTNNFDAVKSLSETLDPAWATLLSDLKTRGLLDSTLVVWMGEFGRTPKINAQKGRDHFPTAWTTALCGGGIRGGQVIGKTSDDGETVIDRPVGTSDLLATVCSALGVDPMRQNMSNLGRPIRLVDPAAKKIEELLV